MQEKSIHVFFWNTFKGMGYFWSIWPKNFLFLVLMSAICEAISVSFFKISGDRGFLSVIGYIFGFFVVAFYAEALRYSKISHSYPIYLVAISVLVSFVSFIVFREKISFQWVIGFTLAIVGIIILEFGLPPES